MNKVLLLGMALLGSATFANAQALNVPFKNLVKNSNKQSSVQTVRGMKPFASKTIQNGWLNKRDLSNMKTQTMAAPFAQSTMKKAPRKADEAQNTWFYYPSSSTGSCYAIGMNALASHFSLSYMSTQTVYDVYCEIPSYYANAVADSVDIVFYDKSSIKDSVYIYFIGMNDSTGTTYKAYGIDTAEVKGLSAKGYLQYTSIALPEKYTIPEGGCYIGYSFVAEEGARPIVTWDNYADNGTVSGSFYYTWYNEAGDGRYWTDMNSYGLGSLTTAVHLDISNTTAANVSIESIGEQTTMAGTGTVISTYVNNDSPHTINSISYVVTVDGTAKPEKTITFADGIASGDYEAVAFDTITFEEGTHEVAVTITKVGGETNISTKKTVDDGYFIALETAYNRNSVVEEITSTSCGYCPRGAVALEKLRNAGVITLASHFDYYYNDPMYVSDNLDFGNYVVGYTGGFPGAMFDRYLAGDPYFSIYGSSYGFTADYLSTLIKQKFPAEAKVTLTADWADEAGNSIKVNTDYEFGYDRMDGNYAIAYILSEDGLAGNDSTWMQLNYYSGDTQWSQFDGMDTWVNAGDYVTTEYNDVVVAVWSSAEGLTSSVSPFFSKGEASNDSRTLSIAGNTIIQNKSKLKLTALLLNNNNGTIANAAQVSLSAPAGINGVTTEANNATEVARYNAAGQRISAPQKGLNIIKLSNGKSLKVINK